MGWLRLSRGMGGAVGVVVGAGGEPNEGAPAYV